MFSGFINVIFFRFFPSPNWLALPLVFFVLFNTSVAYGQELPPVQVVEDEVSIEQASESSAIDDECQAIMVNQDIESRYKKIQEALEADFAQGMPKQLKTDLVRVREDIDSLTVKLYDVDTEDSQEVNHIAQLTIDYLEKMISLLPKATRIAPQVRDRYVVPFTNISSIRAEHQDCLMKAAVDQVKDQEAPADTGEAAINIYQKLTQEMERLNTNLYTLQTTDVQRFVNYRAYLLRNLEAYNKDQKPAQAVTAELPLVLNNVQREIEKLLPGLELSKEYLTVAH